jgi:tetratricopeptide (TPR) repeat protein
VLPSALLMSQSTPAPKPPTPHGPPGPGGQPEGAVQIQGGAAILAPITAFPNGVPGNAMVLIPLGPNGQPVEKQIVEGPMAVTMEQVWKLLGFNGPAVQVQDEQGRPIAIGLEDLLAGLEKHWKDSADDLDRGRIYAQELMKYNRHDKAEAVLAKIVARGGDGNDWLGLGVAQLAQDKLDKAEGTLKGAQNLMKDNPYPSLHLAKLFKGKKDAKAERENVERAIQIQPGNVDAWAYLFNFIKESESEDAAIKTIEELANAPVNAKTAAPYVALQGFYANEESTRDKAIGFAKKAVDRNRTDPIPLIVLSALYGQAGKIDEVVKLLAPHEALMKEDVRLAHNYFEALFQSKDMAKITGLLNKLATSSNKEVKQFAIERSRAIAQMLQQQQQALQAAAEKA